MKVNKVIKIFLAKIKKKSNRCNIINIFLAAIACELMPLSFDGLTCSSHTNHSFNECLTGG